ncbi:T9SS type A sorting domain-containing protein [uncultured Algibacter sp.]|uniref:T9SS type A sorting domain-containing protein n=1 Tax=uncultured Algibacter sp. TaxID=298659 RepID=UPI003217CBDE
MLRTIKLLILLFVLSSSMMMAQTNVLATFAKTPIETIETNALLNYTINVDASIPDVMINGSNYAINFGEVILEIHEVDATDINNINDTANQVLITTSNAKVYNNGNGIFSFNMKAPSLATNELTSNRKYRVRLANTGIGKSNASMAPLEINVVNTTVLSNDENPKLKNITIYPNPATDRVSISTPINKVSLYDLGGRYVLESKSNSFSIKNLKPGIYLAKIETVQGQIANYKIVKK